MRNRICVSALLMSAAAVLSLGGCAEKLPDGPRIPVYPVMGKVTVDGRPAEYLSVRFEPQFEKKPEVPEAGGFTDKEGKFAAGTFESSDGAPPGKYKLTFMWGQLNLLNGQYGGPDKLKGRYQKAASAKHEVTVVDQPIDLGTIELTTK